MVVVGRVTESVTQRPSCLYHCVLGTDAPPRSPHPPAGYTPVSDAVIVSWKPNRGGGGVGHFRYH